MLQLLTEIHPPLSPQTFITNTCINIMENNLKRIIIYYIHTHIHTHIYVMNFCAVHLKRTQYCKSIKKTILQLKKKLLQRRFLEQQQQI